MGGEIHPTADREDPTPTWEPPTDSHVEPGSGDGEVEIPEMPSGGPTGPLTGRKIAFGALFITAALVGLYFLVPKLTGLNQTWGRLKRGDPLWLAVAAGFEMLSIAGYAVLFRTVFARGVSRLSWRASIEIPLAGIAAIRLLAAAGAGGVAVTVWALRRAGMSPRVIACRIAANYSVQYSLYLLAMVVAGFGLWTGAFAGGGPAALTLIPAVLSAVALILGAAMGLVPGDFERRLEHLARRKGRIGRLAHRFATLPATLGSGVRTAIGLIRDRHWGLLGAVAYWAFDIACLGASFRAFGTVVPGAVLVMGYFLGTLGSLLPLPGGIGGVEGGMIGAFAAFGEPAGRAVIAVLAYRAISFWLPTLPGIGGYVTLRSTVRGWRMADEAIREGLADPELDTREAVREG
ncbi:MAG TPA: lysylphosphatidylglycerol synthase transmembrane domain-containing protein [Solirubrobacteraceae bacterium]|nr:lysylphosphatidylglycerol synthase transmembrane domain-containing protein [Solirubrobacteraceae bacterium]